MIVRLCLALMWCAAGAVLVVCLACATRVHISTAAYDLSAEVNTGTTIAVTKDSVVIERKSVEESITAAGGLAGSALRMLVGLP